jgi:hypothetical protein
LALAVFFGAGPQRNRALENDGQWSETQAPQVARPIAAVENPNASASRKRAKCGPEIFAPVIFFFFAGKFREIASHFFTTSE